MSAFLGGVAQGFLQAKVRSEEAAAQAEKDRIQRLEAQKDRQLRLDIADKQIEMQRQTLLNQQKSAKDRRDIQLATPAYQDIIKTIENNPRGAHSGNYSPTINAAVQKYFGLSVDKNGYYTSPTRYDDAQKLRAEASFEKLQPYLHKGMDTTNIPPGAIEMFMRRAGYKDEDINNPLKVREVSDQIKKRHYTKLNLLNLTDFRKSTGQSGNEISYPSKDNENLLVYDAFPDFTNFDNQSLSILHNLTDTQKNDLARNVKNDNIFRHGRLGIAERHLRNIEAKHGIDSLAFKAHSQAISKVIKKDFITAATIAKNNGDNHVVYMPDAKTTIIEQLDTHKRYPTLKRILQYKDNVPSSVSQSQPLTLDKVNKSVSKATGLSETEVNNLQVTGKVKVEKVPPEIEGLVIDNPPGTYNSNLIVPGQDNSESTRITVTNDDASMSSEPMMIEETLANIIKHPNGSEAVHVGAFTPSSFKRYEREFNRIMSLEGLGNLREQYLEQEGLTKKFELLKPVFKARDAFFANATDDKNYNNFRNAVASAFNLADLETGVVDPRNIDFALQKIVERQVIKEETGGYSSELVANADGSLSIRKIRQTAEDEKLAREYKKDLVSANDKLNKTDFDVKEFRKNGELIGLLKEYQEGTLDMESAEARKLLKGLLDMPGLVGNNEANNALRQGLTIATDATQFLTSGIQKIKDFGTAFSTVFNDVINFANNPRNSFLGVSPERLLMQQEMKRGYDWANNGMTAQRLRDVQDLMPKEAEKLKQAMNDDLVAASKATSTQEIVKSKLSAFRNYLLAKNLMTKVTLTYNYAGMVQGESGGRAISNEDFAILYRAIWGTSGGDFMLGSFKRLEETIDYLKERNENALAYVDFKNGQAIANKMQKFNRSLRRQSPLYGPALDEAVSFSLRRLLENRPQQNAGDIAAAKRAVYYPRKLMPRIQDGKGAPLAHYDDDLSMQRQFITRQRFTRDVAIKIWESLPDRETMSQGTTRTTKVPRPMNYGRLSDSQKKKVLDEGKSALIALIHENGTVFTNVMENLDRYGTSNIRLGTTIYNAYKHRLGEESHNYTTQQQNFLESLIKDLYNSQPPKRAE